MVTEVMARGPNQCCTPGPVCGGCVRVVPGKWASGTVTPPFRWGTLVSKPAIGTQGVVDISQRNPNPVTTTTEIWTLTFYIFDLPILKENVFFFSSGISLPENLAFLLQQTKKQTPFQVVKAPSSPVSWSF